MVTFLSIVRAKVVLRGLRGSKECTALVDTGAAMSVVDEDIAEVIGIMRTNRRKSLVSATGHKLEGEVIIIKELDIEGEILDYEKALMVKLSEEVKSTLRKLNVDDSVIIGLTTVELAGFLPDTTTGRLRKVEAFLLSASDNAMHHNFLAGVYPRLDHPEKIEE